DYAGLPALPQVSNAAPASPQPPSPPPAPPVPAAKAPVKSSAQAAWAAYEKSIGVPLRNWAALEVAPPKGGTAFYPFSGPDLVTVAQMFPDAERYILVAIQPAGAPVELSSKSPAALAAFRQKFSEEWVKFGVLGFFRTLDLNENTASTTAQITSTPVMMAFAASLGFRVDAVHPLIMNPDKNEFEPTVPSKDSKWASVRLDLSKDERKVVVDYVCLDLSDEYLKAHPHEAQWLKNCSKNPTLLKAASHLLPKPYFSICRTDVVEGAPLLVQDETGLEYKDLKKIGPVKLYGRFVEAHKLFDPNSQRDLAAAYVESRQTSPLPFSYSYQKAADRRSLQVVRREAVQKDVPKE
ncbi:MAG: hypothetical protein ORN83_12125, partial [Chthoniobacteraceae bacterium]|nr:hypothetical protein [Chthoniobacteraceae bacterium]